MGTLVYGGQDKPHLGGFIAGGDPNTWEPRIWDYLIETLKTTSILDIGCGEGRSLQYFSNKGITTTGIEGSLTAKDASPVPQLMITHDFITGPWITTEKYDLVWSEEFVEHVAEQYAENFLKTMEYGKYVAMTHAVPRQAGYHHVNCQSSEYWIQKLNEHGFILDTNLTTATRQLANGIYYRNTGMVFKNTSFKNVI